MAFEHFEVPAQKLVEVPVQRTETPLPEHPPSNLAARIWNSIRFRAPRVEHLSELFPDPMFEPPHRVPDAISVDAHNTRTIETETAQGRVRVVQAMNGYRQAFYPDGSRVLSLPSDPFNIHSFTPSGSRIISADRGISFRAGSSGPWSAIQGSAVSQDHAAYMIMERAYPGPGEQVWDFGPVRDYYSTSGNLRSSIPMTQHNTLVNASTRDRGMLRTQWDADGTFHVGHSYRAFLGTRGSMETKLRTDWAIDVTASGDATWSTKLGLFKPGQYDFAPEHVPGLNPSAFGYKGKAETTLTADGHLNGDFGPLVKPRIFSEGEGGTRILETKSDLGRVRVMDLVGGDRVMVSPASPQDWLRIVATDGIYTKPQPGAVGRFLSFDGIAKVDEGAVMLKSYLARTPEIGRVFHEIERLLPEAEKALGMGRELLPLARVL